MKIMVSACLAGENCKYNGCGAGAGVTAQLLMENGFRCVDVEDLFEI